MEKNVLEILACPICKGELIFDRHSQELICRFDRKVWPIVDGVPVMLESRSRRLDVDE
ncbi:MAG: Trm112 family protein [Gammaproteobacteria bacterium]|nr:Trm112 family protein [Gammaproteobacteria bacterium]